MIFFDQEYHVVWIQTGVYSPLGKVIRVKVYFESTFKEYDKILDAVGFVPKIETRHREDIVEGKHENDLYWVQDYELPETSKWIGLAICPNSLFYSRKWMKIYEDPKYPY